MTPALEDMYKYLSGFDLHEFPTDIAEIKTKELGMLHVKKARGEYILNSGKILTHETEILPCCHKQVYKGA